MIAIAVMWFQAMTYQPSQLTAMHEYTCSQPVPLMQGAGTVRLCTKQ